MHMRQLSWLLASAVFGVGAMSVASAADLPGAGIYEGSPAYVPSAYNWTGWYAGVNVGYGFGNGNDATFGSNDPVGTNFQQAIASGVIPSSLGLDPRRVIGGGQIGYNWQFNNRWVAGLEADLQSADIRDSASVINLEPNINLPITTTASSRLEYLGTVRGRLGYAWDRVLFYGTGGLAYGGLRQSASFAAPAVPGVIPSQFYSGFNSSTKTGFAAGGGIEYAFFGNWTVRAEYLYYDLGTTTVNIVALPASLASPASAFARFDNSGHIVRAALNYRF